MNKFDPIKLTSYESDFALWAAEQGTLLREGRLDRLDLENLAEEIESLGISNKRQIESRMAILLMHLLKWYYQPEFRCGSWRSTIHEQRRRIARVVRDSPSLKHYPSEILSDEYSSAREKAAMETTVFLDLIPTACPYTIEQVLDPDFLPGQN
jgi:hypothetical protein